MLSLMPRGRFSVMFFLLKKQSPGDDQPLSGRDGSAQTLVDTLTCKDSPSQEVADHGECIPREFAQRRDFGPLVRELAATGTCSRVPVAVACRVLGLTNQDCDEWLKGPVSQRD